MSDNDLVWMRLCRKKVFWPLQERCLQRENPGYRQGARFFALQAALLRRPP